MREEDGSLEKRLISLVVPVYNNKATVLPFHISLSAATASLETRYDFEIVFTDSHSEDGTFVLLEELARRDRRVRVYRLSRNFGIQRAIMTGYAYASGDAAIQMDVHLQDPPELISRFLEEWEKGADVVYGVSTTPQEGWITTLQRKIFYRLVDRLSEDKFPVDAYDFRLISRRVIELLKCFADAKPYLHGTIASLGFKQIGVPYSRRVLAHKNSRDSLPIRVSSALHGILTHSVIPLRLSTYLGVAISFSTLIAVACYICIKLLYGSDWPHGFTTLAVMVLLGISINALLLGIVGEYLGRMYQQMRNQPLTIIERTAGLPNIVAADGEITVSTAAE